MRFARSHAELIALPKCSGLTYILRVLSATENEKYLLNTSISGNQKRH